MNPDELVAILDLLRENGVEEFECKGFHVRFSSLVQRGTTPEFADPDRAETKAEIDTLWQSRTLWGSGGPPSFPKKNK